jgi:hypothetical protein
MLKLRSWSSIYDLVVEGFLGGLGTGGKWMQREDEMAIGPLKRKPRYQTRTKRRESHRPVS